MAVTWDKENGFVLPGGVRPVVRSEALHRLLTMAHRVASSEAAVLIEGETGSGKEVIARALHEFSIRCEKPWVDVNCGALPEQLMESELFGYEKGAFSGAESTKPGLFELANEGTLFLDEIGELDSKLQVKLLRVLDGVPYYRLGGTKKVTVKVRVIAATNRDLREAVRLGTFRKDLFHRISHVQLLVPPLRGRREDIEGIAEQVLADHRPGTRFSPDAMQCLRSYGWPGNVRELKSVVISTALGLEEGVRIVSLRDLPAEVRGGPVQASSSHEVPLGDLDSMERLMIERALQRCGGDQERAADQLGISRRTLIRKLKIYGVTGGRAAKLGLMDGSEQRYFRAALNTAVTLRSALGDEVQTEGVNVSCSGLGVQGMREAMKFDGIFDVEFQMPDTDITIAAKCKLAWADSEGRAGIRFLSMDRQSEQRLDRWLDSRRVLEGWASPDGDLVSSSEGSSGPGTWRRSQHGG